MYNYRDEEFNAYIRAHLEELISGRGDVSGGTGICGSMMHKMGLVIPNLDIFDTDKHLFRDWSYYSGDRTYPVPDPASKESSKTIYNQAADRWGGAYGQLRVGLCIWLLEGMNNGVTNLLTMQGEYCKYHILCRAKDEERVKKEWADPLSS